MDSKQQYKTAYRMIRLWDRKRMVAKDEKGYIETLINDLRPDYRHVQGRADVAAHRSFYQRDCVVICWLRCDWSPELRGYQHEGIRPIVGYAAQQRQWVYSR